MIKKKIMPKFVLMVFVILFISLSIKSIYAVEKAERVSDREIIESLATLKEGQKAINQRFDDLNRRFDDVNRRFDDLNNSINQMRNFITWGFGVLFTGFCTLMGFVLWDRRTALAPAVRKNKELEEREEELERWKKKTDMALKELAVKDVKVAEVLRHVGLL